MKRIMTIALVMGFLVMGMGFAQARHEKGDQGICKEDVKKYCKDAKPGKDKHACIKDNNKKFSKACRENLKERKKEFKEKWKACKDDRKKFCKSTEDEDAPVRECLKKHKKELSEGCRSVFKK